MKRIVLIMVLVLLVPFATAGKCENVTSVVVSSNTNPNGDPNKKCLLRVTITYNDGTPNESRDYERSPATCKRCQVGADWVKCQKETGPGAIQNQTRDADRRQILGLLTVTMGSTHKPIFYIVTLWGEDGLERDHWRDTERSLDKVLRIPVIINQDTKLTVAVESMAQATVSCQITYAAGSIGLASEMTAGGKGYCSTLIKGNPKIPQSSDR